MPIAQIYAISKDTDNEFELISSCQNLLHAGCSLIQYRNKSTKVDHQQVASKLLTLCHQHAAKLIINDSWQLALKINADGCHLGQQDESLPQLLRQLAKINKPNFIIGISCHSDLQIACDAYQLLQAHLSTISSYFSFGAVEPSATKPHAKPCASNVIDAACSWRDNLPNFTKPKPKICIVGGLNCDNLVKYLKFNIDYLAISKAIQHPEHFRACTQQILTYYQQHV